MARSECSFEASALGSCYPYTLFCLLLSCIDFIPARLSPTPHFQVHITLHSFALTT
jgi:hypothetical protein